MIDKQADIKTEEQRILSAYQKRDRNKKPDLYSWRLPETLWFNYRIESQIARALKNGGNESLSELEILDVGCGSGGLLRTLSEWGVDPVGLHGIDLLEDRIQKAKNLSPNLDFHQSSGFDLPFADNSMNRIFSLVVFSSILDAEARKILADEIQRVLKPGIF